MNPLLALLLFLGGIAIGLSFWLQSRMKLEYLDRQSADRSKIRSLPFRGYTLRELADRKSQLELQWRSGVISIEEARQEYIEVEAEVNRIKQEVL